MEKSLEEYFTDEYLEVDLGHKFLDNYRNVLTLIRMLNGTPAPDKYALIDERFIVITDFKPIDKCKITISDLKKAFDMKLTSPTGTMILPFGANIYINHKRYILTKFMKNAFLVNQGTGISDNTSLEFSNEKGLTKNEMSLLCDLKTSSTVV